MTPVCSAAEWAGSEQPGRSTWHGWQWHQTPFAQRGRQVHTRRRRGPLAQWPAVLPISSTVLPFQWNRTSVVKPLMAPGYVKATVSPLVCDASMPLNP